MAALRPDTDAQGPPTRSVEDHIPTSVGGIVPIRPKSAFSELTLCHAKLTGLDRSRGWTLWVGLLSGPAPKEAHPRGQDTPRSLDRQRRRTPQRQPWPGHS